MWRAVYAQSVHLIISSRRMKLTELPDVHDVVLVLQDSSLVVVHIKIVRRAEDCHDTGEAGSPCLSVHAVASILRFVRSNNREEVILFKEGACGWVREKVGATSNVVVHEEIVCFLLSKFFERIGPQDVAHKAVGGRFAESINLGCISQFPIGR